MTALHAAALPVALVLIAIGRGAAWIARRLP
jgi:hypothetical protein